jgi:hypothetical protein
MSGFERFLEDLPGADLVLRGLEDLGRARATAEAALVEVAATRLRELGLPVPEAASDADDAELRLYTRLGARHPERDPYVLYGAWLDQLASFVAALRQRRENQAARAPS